MDRRRFVSVKDLVVEEDGVHENPLFDAFVALLADLVTPIFAEVYPELDDIELTSIEDKENDVVMLEISGYALSPMKKNVHRDFDPIITEFADKKQRILNGVNWAISPTMKESLLEQYDINAEQFLVKTVKVEVLPRLTTSYSTRAARDDRNYAGETLFIMAVVFYLSIEDLSTLEPGGDEAVRLRYNNLCSERSRYSENELRSWAVELGLNDAGEMTKEELCQAVKQYYGW